MRHDRRRSIAACQAIQRNLHRRRLRDTPKPEGPPEKPEHVPRRKLTWPVLVFLGVTVAPLLWEAVVWGLGW